MPRYKVIALSVGGLNNKIYHSGDEVTDECFEPGHAKMLVKQKFLKALDTPEPQPEPEQPGPEEAKTEEMEISVESILKNSNVNEHEEKKKKKGFKNRW